MLEKLFAGSCPCTCRVPKPLKHTRKSLQVRVSARTMYAKALKRTRKSLQAHVRARTMYAKALKHTRESLLANFDTYVT